MGRLTVWSFAGTLALPLCLIVLPIYAQSRPGMSSPVTDRATVPIDVLQRTITVRFKQVTLATAVRTIGDKAGIRIGYNLAVIPVNSRVSLDAEKVTVAEALRRVLVGTDVTIMVTAEGNVLLVRGKSKAEAPAPGTITGRVTERGTNAPVPAAQVTVSGVSSRYTDDKGQYRIPNVPVGEHEVTVKRVGLEAIAQRIRVGEGETVTADFMMGRVPTTLTEMVTTATGERSRVEVGNSIGTIKADSIVPTTLIRNFSDLLTARTPGVIVSNGIGAVGAPSKIRIRGVNSIYLNNDPVIVIDGVRVNSTVTAGTSQTNTGNLSMPSLAKVSVFYSAAPSRLDDIDPNTIESIDVLRGPSAASLYGTDAVNGVIVIKTKRGVTGPFRFNILADDGSSVIGGGIPDYWYGWGHMANGATTSKCGLAPWALAVGISSGTCVQDSVTHFNPAKDPNLSTFGTGMARNVSVNMSGGTDQLKEFLSMRVSDLVGLAKLSNVEARRIAQMWGSSPPSWMMRPNTEQDVTGSSRTSFRISPALDVSLSVNALYRNVVSDNTVMRTDFLGPWDTLAVLPAEDQRSRQASLAKRAFASVNATYVPTPWLTMHASLGGDYTLRSDNALLRSSDCTVLLTPSGCPSAHSNDREEPVVTNLDIGAQFSFMPLSWLGSRTAIGEQVNRTQFYGLRAENSFSTNLAFGTDLLTPTPVATSGTPQLLSVTESRDASASAGFYIEQTAAIRERLFLVAGFRQDAASAFGPSVNKRLPVYPKFSLSWLLSDETFFPYRNVITSFRLRSAYGHSGNQASQTDILPNYSQVLVVTDGISTPGMVLSQVPNPNLRPERSEEWEGGFDASLFQNERIHVEATMYRKLSKDAIVQIALPASVGTANANGSGINRSQRVNVGSVENRGLELSVTAKLLDTRTFGWDLTVNLSQNGNKLVYRDSRFPADQRFTAGYPIFGYWGTGVASYVDRNGDGILDNVNDVAWFTGPGGNPQIGPDNVFYGVGYPKSELTYDNAVTLWSGAVRLGAKLDQVNGATISHASVDSWNFRCDVDPTCTLKQQVGNLQSNRKELTSSLRLSELSATYNLPRATARRFLRAQSAAITFAGRNLALWTNSLYGDPDLSTQSPINDDLAAGNVKGYPQPQQWTLRLNLGF